MKRLAEKLISYNPFQKGIYWEITYKSNSRQNVDYKQKPKYLGYKQ